MQGDAVAPQRRGLGRGLGALIPEATPSQGVPANTNPSATSLRSSGAFSAVAVDAPASEPTFEPPLRQVAGAYFEEVEVGAIAPNPRQPRRTFDEDALDELALSIAEVGLLQPVVVRHLGGGQYELVMGERRWRASQRAGLTVIPAIVRETHDDAMLRDALMENLHRQQLDPLEEAAA
jgi:ParB family chromosome partitioning protein